MTLYLLRKCGIHAHFVASRDEQLKSHSLAPFAVMAFLF